MMRLPGLKTTTFELARARGQLLTIERWRLENLRPTLFHLIEASALQVKKTKKNKKTMRFDAS